MEKYFGKRTEGDLAETQKIVAEGGHSRLVAQAYSANMRKHHVKTAESFFMCLALLMAELAKLEYTKSEKGWYVPGRRLVPFGRVTNRQWLGSFASVQQAVGKWIYNHSLNDLDLFDLIQEADLVFKANDVAAVMGLLFELFVVGHVASEAILQFESDRQSPNFFQTRVLKCLRK